MKLVTKSELIKLAKMQDPEPKLYKMTYWDIERIYLKIAQLVQKENDDKLFSKLMRLKSHLMVVEDHLRKKEDVINILEGRY